MLRRSVQVFNRLAVRRRADVGRDARALDRAGPGVELRGRGVSLRARLLAGLSLAALLLAAVAALPTQAQTTTVTLVSNVDITANNQLNSIVLQSFTTGPNPGGYDIVGLEISFGSTTGKSTSVAIHGNFNVEPSHLLYDEIAAFDGPDTLTPNDFNTFEPTQPLTLDPDTTYQIMVNRSVAAADRATVNRGDADDDSGADGWSIDNSGRQRPALSGVWIGSTSSLIFTLKGLRPLSADATLSDLAVTDRDGNAVTLDPAFASDEYSYLASVGYPVSQVTVLPTKNDEFASVRVLDGDDNLLNDADRGQTGFQVDLVAGAENVIKVEVTAEDGTTQTYTVTVTRAAQPGQVLVSTKSLSLTEGEVSRGYTLVLDRRPSSSVTVTIGGHVGTPLTRSPSSLTFTTSNWNQPQWVSLAAAADSNTTNEAVTLTHTATSSDSLFDGITIPSVIVNVDDADAPDHHIHTIRLPQGSYDLPPGDKALPEEEFVVWTGDVFGRIEGGRRRPYMEAERALGRARHRHRLGRRPQPFRHPRAHAVGAEARPGRAACRG